MIWCTKDWPVSGVQHLSFGHNYCIGDVGAVSCVAIFEPKVARITWIAFPKITKAKSFAVEYHNPHRVIVIPP
jgi:hypothetical protein